MKIKRLYFFGIVVVVLIGWLAVSAAFDPKEPSYDGHTLSQWLIIHNTTFGPYIENVPPTQAQIHAQLETSERAIKIIGTNAIPTALRWLSKKYNVRDYFHIDAFFRGYPLSSMGEDLFGILGEQAKSAKPGLAQIAKDGRDAEVRKAALHCLWEVGADRKTLLTVFMDRATNDSSAKIRDYALNFVVLELGVDNVTGKKFAGALLDDADKEVRKNAQLFYSKADFFFNGPHDQPANTKSNNTRNK